MRRRRPAASRMIGSDIVSIGLPDRPAVAPLAEESHPDHKIAAIGPQAIRRTYAHGGAGAKKPIELEVIPSIIIKDEWQALAQTGLLRRRDRGGGEGRQSTLRHHSRPAKSGQFREIELRHEIRCGGLRTGGLKPASAQTTTSPRHPNQSLIRRSVALMRDTRETRPKSPDNAEIHAQEDDQKIEPAKLVAPMLARFMS